MLRDLKIGCIGGGNMAEAIIRGLLAGKFPASAITVAEPQAERQAYLRAEYGVTVTGDNRAAATAGDAIILAVKPQVATGVLAEIAPHAAGKLFISIMAGISTGSMEEALGKDARLVRVMPNTPALVLAGASALCRGVGASDQDLHLARALFELIGTTAVVDEKLMDAVTGLSGSGPAYVFTFIEALSDAGVKNGLPRDVAADLATQTVFGAARMILQTGEHPAILREKVTSPGGTTIAGLHALESGGFRSAVINSVDAATARSRELGKK